MSRSLLIYVCVALFTTELKILSDDILHGTYYSLPADWPFSWQQGLWFVKPHGEKNSVGRREISELKMFSWRQPGEVA